ncbi:MAG: mannose-6-phosphate isomerase, class I [Candidatus Auribacterota bacterium]|nr:mannose-6-phosphate isomerase, class I [Candidatus Auribacterota bacterium]
MFYRLKNTIQHYSWGSRTFIPELLGKSSPAENPWAELWMGDHPRAPSRAITPEGEIPLSRLIHLDPRGMLGEGKADTLPFLFKVLAAAHPLSIQAHPNLDQARKGYARENAAGISPDAFQRNYKDPYHKPELICALTPFEALSGFRGPGEIADLMTYLEIDREIPGGKIFLKNPTPDSLRDIFSNLLNLTGGKKSRLLAHLSLMVSRTQARSREEKLAFDWILKLRTLYPDDIGILAPVLMNTLCLQPGEALYMSAGVLHAYLDGSGIEIMANSDNVLRGGLTAKHMDIPELLKSLSFAGGPVQIIRPESADGIEFIYPTPAREFQLSRIELTGTNSFITDKRDGGEIILCLKDRGRISAKAFDQTLEFKKGEAIFIPFKTGNYSLRGTGTLFCAATPKK